MFAYRSARFVAVQTIERVLSQVADVSEVGDISALSNAGRLVFILHPHGVGVAFFDAPDFPGR